MSSDRERNQRRSLRLINYDYAQAGFYFVTLCAHQRQRLFGTVDKGLMQVSPAGLMIEDTWKALPARFPSIELDDFVIMPNHLHGLLRLRTEEGSGREGIQKEGRTENREGRTENREGRTQGSPLRRMQAAPAAEYQHPIGTETGSLGRIIQAFKSLTTHQYTVGVKEDGWPAFDSRIWQRDYHDHIVRDEAALDKIRRYIVDNPLQWDQDDENPCGDKT